MSSHRTRLILAGALAVAAALTAIPASGGLVQPAVDCSGAGEGAELLFSAVLPEGQTLLSGAASMSPGPAEPGPPQDDDDREAAWAALLSLPAGPASCGSESSPSSTGSGATNAAVPSATSHLPETKLTARLPAEIHPSLSNPPPWTPLRPPRDSS